MMQCIHRKILDTNEFLPNRFNENFLHQGLHIYLKENINDFVGVKFSPIVTCIRIYLNYSNELTVDLI